MSKMWPSALDWVNGPDSILCQGTHPQGLVKTAVANLTRNEGHSQVYTEILKREVMLLLSGETCALGKARKKKCTLKTRVF